MLKLPHRVPNLNKLLVFLQGMIDRFAVGHYRYGPANPIQGYLEKLEKELKHYKRHHNKEQLLNIAVYCFLEFHWSLYDQYHKDEGSVTRRSEKEA